MDGFLLLAFLFLVAGVVAVPIASKLGLGSVLGYLIAGIALRLLIEIIFSTAKAFQTIRCVPSVRGCSS